MPKISVSDLKPGMVLAKPLARGNMVILGEGTVLNEAWISRLDDMNVEHVYIDGPSEQPVSKEQALRDLEARFRNVIDMPHMRALNNLVKNHIESLYGR
ncbi:MAG: hypothetical protein JXA41_10060 [Deltaproteobacteria bacterium]|nr:hypothetical protein [Deltaproteobacteria bacterium]